MTNYNHNYWRRKQHELGKKWIVYCSQYRLGQKRIIAHMRGNSSICLQAYASWCSIDVLAQTQWTFKLGNLLEEQISCEIGIN